MRIRRVAQSRRSSPGVRDIVLYVVAIAAVLALVYMFFWYNYSVHDAT